LKNQRKLATEKELNCAMTPKSVIMASSEWVVSRIAAANRGTDRFFILISGGA
jgi:hypothetical protein